ncbi:hypothetical protein AV530_012817 [Patagioenas fasciata monilis]|uniref:Uncharacterized protein n=1 Tax=Patagioenas fasciata monilis TaxID=372326 RepID=A0A1V4J9J5_PATFA|nr:hypothetical protein AV530_012817 [Patagioenas fasciata monilis]
MENAKVEATVQQQGNKIEVLQRDQQTSASRQKQNMLALTPKDSHSMWEEKLKSRSHLEEHVAQSDGKKVELLEQVE